ncbi:MAG: hypothetical protein QOI15_207 [Pseudonocardiales bacterium]|jgi:hypothetical protein|nr:hypothetical protein [Pseudonocardiales bacterium]MDT4919305.1 hypothetical protein [Pseudonocardiales bacterium]MDT4942892.1 hypothetical protein [Pseudonocardiales bacterium]
MRYTRLGKTDLDVSFLALGSRCSIPPRATGAAPVIGPAPEGM